MSDAKPQNEPSMDEILTTVRRIIAEDEAGATPPPSTAQARSGGGDILELTEVLEADGSVRHIPPFGMALRATDGPRAEPLPDGRIEPAPPSPTVADQPSVEAGRLSSGSPIEDEGKREPVVSAVAPAVADLAASSDGGVHLGGAPALEGMVRDMLRPMLQRWMDEHLPVMVEEAVRAEVARVAAETAAPRRAARTRPKAKPDEG
jgi:cell pole-organizing protein PopZ